jgi:hypothetical protein
VLVRRSRYHSNPQPKVSTLMGQPSPVPASKPLTLSGLTQVILEEVRAVWLADKTLKGRALADAVRTKAKMNVGAPTLTRLVEQWRAEPAQEQGK